MTLNIEKGQRVTVWSVEDKGTYSLVSMSSSRKDKKSGEYKNTSWSFVRFVGEAHKKAGELKEKDRIELHGAILSREEYEDEDGNRAWPKNPQFVVFNWQYPDNADASGGYDAPPKVQVEPDDDELPF